MKKIISIILAVCVICGLIATMTVAADETPIKVYHDFYEITDVKDLVPGQVYLLIKELKMQPGEALIGVPEGSAEIKFGGTELNEETAQKSLPDIYASLEVFEQYYIRDFKTDLVEYGEWYNEQKALYALDDTALQQYLVDEEIDDYYTVPEFREELENDIKGYEQYKIDAAEFLDFIDGKISSINNDNFCYANRQEYLDELEEDYNYGKSKYLRRTAGDDWDSDGEITNTENIQGFVGVNIPGEGFDSCKGGGIVWVEAEKCWYYGCWAGGVEDLPGFHIYSFTAEEVLPSEIKVSLKPGITVDENTKFTEDMVDIKFTSSNGNEYFFTTYSIASSSLSTDGNNANVEINFAGTILPLTIKIKEDPQPEPKVESKEEVKEEIKTVNNDVPKTADNNVVLFAGIIALLSTTALVVLRKKA